MSETLEFVPDKGTPTLEHQFGGGWCDCIKSVIRELSPQKLAAYCVAKKYQPYPEASEDEIGIRYSYYLYTVEQVRSIGGKGDEEHRTVNVIASFCDIHHRSYESRKSVLEAIIKIASYEDRSAQQVAIDVTKCDPKNAPVPKKANMVEPPIQPGQTRRIQIT